MQPTQDNYPVFEANQVLTNAHLNQVFKYLDEQERLTRANLIGIGIVCGLDIRLDQAAGATIHLSKGCGVTSQGYLIVEQDDVALVAYREYRLPNDLEYPLFRDNSATPVAQYPLWELFPADEPNTTALGTPAVFLQDKAVLLFLELKKEGLRNCSPNNCDDKGAQVTARVRRLLIGIEDLKKIIAEANQLGTDLTSTDLEAALTDRLHLPDLRMPRYDVPNTGPVTTQQVLAAFHAVFHTGQLALHLGNALSAAYHAFQPVVQENYPDAPAPLSQFHDNFGFLDTAPVTTDQVRFLQYYYDFFGDLLGAYDEFRWKGLELLCACCPPAELFPRHLMLGLLFPDPVAHPGVYRHHFLASGALSGCASLEQDLIQLFRRLVEMIAQFTHTPPLPQTDSRADTQIRITPSKLADVPLSDKAIPYYYRQTGTPPLFQLWNTARTRRNRANQNPGYRSDEYTPAAPAFVTNALRYDLEPYNFLCIEGHLGKDYQRVLSTLLSLKSRYRLPIAILALRTGAFDENIPLDLDPENCRFADLDTFYHTLQADLSCFLCQEVKYFYNLPLEISSKVTTPVKALLPLLARCAPDFLVQPQTLGRLFEDWLASQPGGVIPDNDPNIILNADNIGQSNLIIFYVLIYASKLYDQLSADLDQLVFSDFEKRYQDLVSVTDAIERQREQAVGNIEGNVKLLEWEELDDRLEDIIYQCRLDAFRSLHEEYQRRLREARQKLFLGHFLQQHPGIQHKAGVPLGGTFILVYHHDPIRVQRDLVFTDSVDRVAAASRATANLSRYARTKVNSEALAEAFARISANQQLVEDPDVRYVLGTLTGGVPDRSIPPPAGTEADRILAAAVNELADGTVVADFYLPYLCCSDCAPVQFVLPKAPPTFTVQIGCTNPNEQAEVSLTPAGLAPYSVKVDDQDYRPLSGALLLNAGTHTLVIRDAEATESAPQTITIAPRLVLGQTAFDCIGEQNEYIAVFQIAGGTPPYSASRGTVNGNTYTSDNLPGDTDVDITITDSRQCTEVRRVRNTCLPPLAFTVELGCTTANGAPAQVLPTGGSAPYEAQADTGPFAPVTTPLQLAAGPHRIVVRDAAGTLSGPQTVTVPPPLTWSVEEYTCEGTATYRAAIRILGGTPPYTVNGAVLTGNLFTTDPVASGTPFSVEVRDQRACEVKPEGQHTCCPLPCGGLSQRCAYRLWLQPPARSNGYETHRQEDVNILFSFNGQVIDLPDTSNLLNAPAPELNQDFDNAMGSMVKNLNAAVNEALIKALGEEGRNRLDISYAPADTDPFGILWIEHFTCETFHITFHYSFIQSGPGFNLTAHYLNEPDATGALFNGMIINNREFDNQDTRVPAFDCSERNQCTDSDFSKTCKEQDPALTIKIGVDPLDDNRLAFTGEVNNMSNGEIAAWVWDIPGAEEPFLVDQIARTRVRNRQVTVQLTAITSKGCFSFVRRPIISPDE